jgi:hypothetical protein
MNNILFLLIASAFSSLFLASADFASPIFAQQNETSSNMTSMEQQNQTGIRTPSQLENLTRDNTQMMQNNSDISNTSLAEGLGAEQNTTDMTMNQTGEAGQAIMNQTGQSTQQAMNQPGQAGQAFMNETGKALSNASKSDIAQNASQAGQTIANETEEAAGAVVNETGDILSNITEGLKGLFGMK